MDKARPVPAKKIAIMPESLWLTCCLQQVSQW